MIKKNIDIFAVSMAFWYFSKTWTKPLKCKMEFEKNSPTYLKY